MKNTVINSETFKNMIIAGANELEKNKELLNALNVFPVPDGDTGTNMSLTVLAAAKELEKVFETTVSDYAKIVSKGTLRGARGNSGVIVSQLFRGLANGLKDVKDASTDDFINAFVKSKEAAYKAVMKPKEGTILTLTSVIADEAEKLRGKVSTIDELFTILLEKGEIALEQTQEMLPALKQAGVVDSGAKGYLCILQGMFQGLQSKSTVSLETVDNVSEGVGADFDQINPDDIKFAYCTEFFILLEKENNTVEPILKDKLSNLGDSIVVVADETIVKVHVHTNNPGKALEEAIKFGDLDNLKIENMKVQHSELTQNTSTTEEKKDVAIVSVTTGDGLTEIFKNLGCDNVIAGGQSMNPSADDICKAIENINADNIIILPNNSNIILAAEQASKIITDKKVYVVPTKTIPQGINCLINYLPTENIENILSTLNDAKNNIQSGSITYAVRDTMIDEMKISEGDYLFLNEKHIEHTDKDIVNGAVKLVESMMEDEESFVTLYYGQDTTSDVAEKIAETLEEKYEDIEVDIQKGGQPVYYFLISVE